VRSWPGKGSVFSVSVPLAARPRRSKPRWSNRPAAGGAQVLCVDNEDSILIGMNSLLSRWGCQVWTARNQANAPHCWQGMRPQLALVDFHLDHGETGTELMGWLRAQLGNRSGGGDQRRRRPEMVAEVHAAGWITWPSR
jgi:CheY-like chemotaxis protein